MWGTIVILDIFLFVIPYMNMAFSSCSCVLGINSVVPAIAQFNGLTIFARIIDFVHRIIVTVCK